MAPAHPPADPARTEDVIGLSMNAPQPVGDALNMSQAGSSRAEDAPGVSCDEGALGVSRADDVPGISQAGVSQVDLLLDPGNNAHFQATQGDVPRVKAGGGEDDVALFGNEETFGEQFLLTQVSATGNELEEERVVGVWNGLGREEKEEAREDMRWRRKRVREEDEDSVIFVLSDDEAEEDGARGSGVGDEVLAVEEDDEKEEDWEVRSPSCSPPVSPVRLADKDLRSLEAQEARASAARERARVVCVEDFDFGEKEEEVHEVEVREVCERGMKLRDAGAGKSGVGVTEMGLEAHVGPGDAFGEQKVTMDDEGGSADYEGLRTVYHVRAFDYVLDTVLSRYEAILRPREVALVRSYRSMSPGARSLFVRLYRRMPAWHSVRVTSERYRNDWELELDSVKGLPAECVGCGLLASTRAQNSEDVAVEILKGMTAEQLKDVCRVVIDGKALMRKGREGMLAGLLDVAREKKEKPKPARKMGETGRLKRMRQTTINGSDPRERLHRRVLQEERVAVPRDVRYSLRRVNFLFFFDDNGGSESPWVMLADVGKVRFASYECMRTRDVFESARAYTDYDEARGLELAIEGAVDGNNWDYALSLGACAEIEVIEFSRRRRRTLENSLEIASRDKDTVCSLWISRSAPLSRDWDPRYVSEVERALAHPFYRRYSTPVKYARAAWRSVKALEACREYVTAILRIELLLSTFLLPTYAGRMLDRLSVNLVHLNRHQDALDVIESALGSCDHQLHRGEVAVLARRGAAIHKKIRMPIELRAMTRNVKTKVGRKEAAYAAVSASLPNTIASALRKLRTSVPVRMLRGKALPSISAPSSRHSTQGNDTLGGSRAEEDSLRLVGIKSRFVGLGCDSLDVSVEELGLEWYKAHSRWSGAHSEGSALRFIWCLLLWDIIYAPVSDVFQSPYQIAPWDLATEVFYTSRRDLVESRLGEIRPLSPSCVAASIQESYNDELHHRVICIGGAWDQFSDDDLSCIGAGLGGQALARICELLCRDYGYWSGGLPDLVPWKWDIEDGSNCEIVTDAGSNQNLAVARTKLVEVKSQRDILSSKQRAWLSELLDAGVDCEVFKVVEKETRQNAERLMDSELEAAQLRRLDIEDVGCADDD